MQNATEIQNLTEEQNTTEKQAESTRHIPNTQTEPTMRRDKHGRLVIHVPMIFKKHGGRKEIILPPGCNLDDDNDGPSIKKPIAIAVALGHRWLDLLTEGEFQSIGELAEAVNMDPSQLRRHLSLTLMSPRMVKSVMNGNEPDGMSVEGMAREMPVLWE